MNLPTIYLLRHGQTEWNLEGRYQGQLDSPLTLLGKKQAEENAIKLSKHIDIHKVKFFASPLGRAKSTAKIIARYSGLDYSSIIFEKNIQEFNYGIFEGKTKTYCQEQYKEVFTQREADKFNYLLEEGESYAEVSKRLKVWLASISHEKEVVVVAHEMINRTLRGIYCGLKNEEMLQLRQPNDLLIKLENGVETVLE